MPQAGWSWDDLKAFAKAMQDKGGAKWGISLQPGGQRLVADATCRSPGSNGAELVDGDAVHLRHPADGARRSTTTRRSSRRRSRRPTSPREPWRPASSTAPSGRSSPVRGTWGSCGTRVARSSRTSGPSRPCRPRSPARRSSAGRRPRRVQGLQEPRHRLEVRRLPHPAGPGAAALRARRQPAGRPDRVGDRRAVHRPDAQGRSASSCRTPSRRRPSRPGSRSRHRWTTRVEQVSLGKSDAKTALGDARVQGQHHRHRLLTWPP